LTTILVAGLLFRTATSASSSSTPARTSSESHPYSCSHRSCSGLVDIGNKRKIYLECRGTGSPTVVLVAGRSDRRPDMANPSEPETGWPIRSARHRPVHPRLRL
jgi:hypothetical protein